MDCANMPNVTDISLENPQNKVTLREGTIFK